MDFAARLTQLREDRKLSMRKLASRSGLSQAFISGIESGEKQPTIDSLLKLASGFGISLIELLGGIPEAESLPPRLRELLNNARSLTPDQVELLNQFIKSITEPSASKNIESSQYEPLAAHRNDNPMDDLPPEAAKSVVRFKKMVQQNRKKKQ